ncbi:MAG: hypothetical protein V7K32_00295 [Nostoc sp.]|uniref:hypothetical protein n=1 Tax=Nostoc sp. TaxID=1180 RepID=UPI002FF535DA
MFVSTVDLPDYIYLDDVRVNHPEPKLLIDFQTADKSDREVQRLLDDLTSAFSIGIGLLNRH